MGSMIDLIGYMASSLVITTFYVKSMLILRLTAIGSNLAFILYAFECSLLPIFILHMILLPLNLYRIVELKKEKHHFSHQI